MPTRRNDGDTSLRRWRQFIKPFMPDDGRDRRVIELGCNAGFYLRKLADMGYDAIGIENDPVYIEHARYWEEQEPKGVRLIEGDLNDCMLPSAHTVILANVHYWLTEKMIMRLVNRFKFKAMRVIVVGRFRPLRAHRSPCTYEALLKYFKKWDVVDDRLGHKHYAVLFKNRNLDEFATDKLQVFHYGQPVKKAAMIRSFEKLLRKIDRNPSFKMASTYYYKYLCNYRVKRSQRRKLLERYSRLYQDMKDHGLTDVLWTIKMADSNILADGDHRYLIAKHLGISRILCNVTSVHRVVKSRNIWSPPCKLLMSC